MEPAPPAEDPAPPAADPATGMELDAGAIEELPPDDSDYVPTGEGEDEDGDGGREAAG